MIIVDDVYLQSLSNRVGPSGTLKRILKNHDFFYEHGYDVSVCSPEGVLTGFNQLHERPINDANTKRSFSVIGFLRWIVGKIKDAAPNSRFLSVLYLRIIDHRELQHLKKYLSLNRKPDVVIFHSDVGCINYLLRRKENNSKVAVFLHSDGIPYKMQEIYFPRLIGSRYHKWLWDNQQMLAETVDKIVYICKIGRENYLKMFPFVPLSRTSLVVNGIDDLTNEEKKLTEEIKSQKYSKKYRFCCVGSISNRKGQRLILDAMTSMPKEILNDTQIMFVGDGPDRANCEDFVSKHNMNQMVKFTGRVPNNEVYKYLAESNIYILMSENEGLPIAILEAMRSGLAIISTSVSGIPETVDGEKTGILLKPNDKEELATLLSRLDQYDWDEMGRQSRIKFEKEFTFERMRNDYLTMLRELSE